MGAREGDSPWGALRTCDIYLEPSCRLALTFSLFAISLPTSIISVACHWLSHPFGPAGGPMAFSFLGHSSTTPRVPLSGCILVLECPLGNCLNTPACTSRALHLCSASLPVMVPGTRNQKGVDGFSIKHAEKK